jgi:cytosine/adenosine deaminase-related metal-dependent hydrolase
MDPARRVLPSADVLVRGSRIVAVGPGAAEKARRPMRVVACEGRVLLPGFVQAHVHLCQTLFRNHADGLQLLEWLRERIWPFEASHTPQTLRLSA